MPEGHTLHRLAHALDDAFTGRAVEVSSPQGRFAESAAQLAGLPYGGSQAHGKHLFVRFGEIEQDRLINIHLGLIGGLDIGPAGPPVGQVRMRIATTDDSGPALVGDLRGPQICRVITRAEQQAVIAKLGPDPLRADADPDLAWHRIHRSGRSIASLLMDQSVLSGIGNVYRAEVLFRNRINPFREGRVLQRRRWDEIWADLVTLMPEGVRTGRIDTVRPEHTPEAMGRPPRVDDHGGEVYVYRRTGQPCWVCGAGVRTKDLDGRNLFWCGRCQRRG